MNASRRQPRWRLLERPRTQRETILGVLAAPSTSEPPWPGTRARRLTIAEPPQKAHPGSGTIGAFGMRQLSRVYAAQPASVGRHGPFSPGSSFRRGGSEGSSVPRPSWSGRPQCNQQFEADRKICQKAKSPECWESSNKRLGHCRHTSKVSIPPLRFGASGR